MFCYFENIQNRAAWLKLTNKLQTYDQTMVNIYKTIFGKSYNKHFSKYMDENKICADGTHFVQIIDFLVLYYAERHLTDVGTYINDIAHFMTELSEMGYYFTENDSLYCIMYGFILPHFKVIDKTSESYKELKKIINYYLEDDIQFPLVGSKIPDNYMQSFDDTVFNSYVKVKNCKTVGELNELFHFHVTPDKIHLKIASINKNLKTRTQMITLFSKYDIGDTQNIYKKNKQKYKRNVNY